MLPHLNAFWKALYLAYYNQGKFFQNPQQYTYALTCYEPITKSSFMLKISSNMMSHTNFVNKKGRSSKTLVLRQTNRLAVLMFWISRYNGGSNNMMGHNNGQQ